MGNPFGALEATWARMGELGGIWAIWRKIPSNKNVGKTFQLEYEF